MSDIGRLSLVVRHANGDSTRWGADEAEVDRLLQDLTWRTSAPGGFADLTCSLLRGLQPKTDENLFDTVQVIGAGGRILFEGRLHQFPRQSGAQRSVNPSAVGWMAHLDDNPTFTDIFMDRDPNSWQEMAIMWRAGLAGSSIDTEYMPATVGTGGISISLPTATSPAFSISELWYTAPPGASVAQFYVTGTTFGLNNGWLHGFVPLNTQVPTGSVLNPPAGVFNGLVSENAVARSKYLVYRLYSNGVAASQAAGSGTTITKIGVSSATVPLRSRTEPNQAGTIVGAPPGVYASDVIKRAVAVKAPLITFDADSVQATTFPIPHLVFADPTAVSKVIDAANAYHNWDWFVWEDRKLFYQPAGTGTEWHARQADGAQLQLEGDNASELYDRVFVSYDDVATGRHKIAGWPGSGFDVEAASLIDTNLDNPVVANLKSPRAMRIDLSFPTTDDGAVELGTAALDEARLAARSGTITLTGTVKDAGGVAQPVSAVRAGDTVRMMDLPNDAPRRIVETTYSHSNRQISLTINSSSSRLQALIERLIVGTGLLT
jgi:hypothetical protein